MHTAQNPGNSEQIIRRDFHASGPFKAAKATALHQWLPKEEDDGTNQGPATQTKRQWNSILGQITKKQRCSDKLVWIGAMWSEGNVLHNVRSHLEVEFQRQATRTVQELIQLVHKLLFQEP